MEIFGLDQGQLGGLFVILCALLLLLPPVTRLVCGPVRGSR